jgi:hypothetical protein
MYWYFPSVRPLFKFLCVLTPQASAAAAKSNECSQSHDTCGSSSNENASETTTRGGDVPTKLTAAQKKRAQKKRAKERKADEGAEVEVVVATEGQ